MVITPPTMPQKLPRNVMMDSVFSSIMSIIFIKSNTCLREHSMYYRIKVVADHDPGEIAHHLIPENNSR